MLEYNGDDWPERAQESFETCMENGGGMVYAHAMNHTFTDWEEFNLMIGVGGWGGRDERHGPYVKFKNGDMVLDYSPGHAGECVEAHEYAVWSHANPTTR